MTGDFAWEPLLALLAILPGGYLCGVIHELGHAVCGRLVGYKITSFGMGVGRPFWVQTWGATRFYLAVTRPFQGITFAVQPQLYPSRGSLLLFCAGGILFQGVFSLLLLAVSWIMAWGHSVFLVLGAFNGFLAICNLVPFQFQVGPFRLRSDEALMLQSLRLGMVDMPLRDIVHMIKGLRGLWTDLNDTLFPCVYLLAAASDWLALDGFETAQQTWQETEALPCEPLSWLQAYRTLIHGHIAARFKSWEVATDDFARAEKLFVEERHEVGRFLVAFAWIELQALRGDVTGAIARLTELTEQPVPTRRPGLLSILLFTRLTLRASLPGADLPALETQCKAIRRRHPSAMSERCFYLALGRAAAASGDTERAVRSFRAAIVATCKIYDGWTDTDSREAFVASQTALVADAHTLFERLGLFKEAAALQELFPTAKEVQQRRQAAAERRTLGQHRLVCRLALVSLSAAILAGSSAGIASVQSTPLWFAVLLVGAIANLTLFVSLGLQLMGRFISGLRTTFGWFPWLFLLGGWLAAVIGFFFLQTTE